MTHNDLMTLAQRLREYNHNPHHINPMSEAFHKLITDAAEALAALAAELAAIRAAGGEVDKHEAQPEVAENTGSHAMATNQLQRQEQAVDRDVEGVAALCEASLVNDIFAWATFDGEGSYDLRLFEENESYRDNFRRNNPKHHPDWVFPLYRHSIVAAMAAELEQLREEHDKAWRHAGMNLENLSAAVVRIDLLERLLIDARQAMAVHWKPSSVNAMHVKASVIERIDAALAQQVKP